MSDLDPLDPLDPLARGLRQDVARVGWPAAAEIRSRARRRTLAHRAVGTSALVVAILAGTSVGVTLADRRGSAPAPAASSPSSTSPPSPPSPPSSAGPTTGPSRLAAWDVTFVSQQVGWLLAARPCQPGLCPVLLHTADGGHTWSQLPALPAGVGVYATGVRFADPGTGYLYSSDLLYLTRDGGRTWRQQPGYADAIEVANGTALRVSPNVAGCQPGCSYTVSRAPVGGGQWQTVRPTTQFTGAVRLRRGAHRAFVGLFRNPAGGVDAHGLLLTSTDDGATWSSRADPCGTSHGREAVMTSLTAAADGSLAVLCYVRGGSPEQYFLLTSTDAGAHFGQPHPTPGFPLAIGAASAGTLFVAAIDAGVYRLYRSQDGGVHWSAVAAAPGRVVNGDTPSGEIAFSGPSSGHWLAGDDTVFSTTDAGRTWTSSRLPSP